MRFPHTFRSHSSSLTPTGALMVLALVVPAHSDLCFGIHDLGAQAPAEPVPTLMAKRIAEALDGHRTGSQVFVVASYLHPHIVRGVYPTMAEANRAAAVAGRYGVFGPYLTLRDSVGLIGCVHKGPTDMNAYCPLRGLRGVTHDRVDSVSLTVHVHGQPPRSIPLANGVDAVFLSLSAVDKFVVPYYTRLYGPDSAAAMRRQITGRP